MRLPLIILTVLAAFAIVVSGQGRNLSPASAGWGLSRLMTAMQEVKAANALFVERRYLSMLSRPIETSGRLSYFAPDKLRKQTLSPTAGLLIVDGGKLTIEEGPGGNSRTLSLEEYPQLGALVEAIRATLAGDLPSLRRYFDVRLTGGPTAWQLRLEPQSSRLRDFIRSIRIGGSEHEIRSVETTDGDGDHSEMSVVADHR